MKNRYYALATAMVVLCSTMSATTISTEETYNARTSLNNLAPDNMLEIVEGGHLILNDRADHDGPLRVILNGGDLTSTVAYKHPDNNTGEPAFIGIYNGVFTAFDFESFGFDRDANIEIGINGIMIVETGYLADFSNQGGGQRRRNLAVLIDTGALFPSEGLTLNVEDLGEGKIRVTAVAEATAIISAFSARESSTPGGEKKVLLSWSIAPEATVATITADVGGAPDDVLLSTGENGTGSAEVSPAENTTYTLSVTTPAGSDTRELPVLVELLDSVFLSEFLASNDGGLTDADGDASDWLELWNPTGEPVDLSGWFLSDNPTETDKWAFPDGVTLPAGSYMVVFASAKNRAVAGAELHTSFTIDRAAGGSVMLARQNTVGGAPIVVSSIQAYPRQREDTSYGYYGALPEGIGFFNSPTPGAANSDGVLGFVEDTKFSTDRGFYDAEFELVVTSATPGASLVITDDGSAPSVYPPNGTVFPSADANSPPSAELTITTTTTIRAIATKPGHRSTGTDSHTYIFPGHVLAQSNPAAGTWRNWGDPGPVWQMNPAVVNHLDPASRCVPDDLLEIPTLSISLPFSEVWANGGIYISGEGAERACAIEYLNPNGDPTAPNAEGGFEVDGTIQIVGGSSTRRWKSNKLSMRLKFSPDLEAAVFDKPWIPFGSEATDQFDTLVLDARLNNVWNHPSHDQRVKGQYVRDQYIADLQNASGGTAPHGRHMHVYVGGYYWGMHTVHERPDDNFAATYLGGENTDYDVVKHDGGNVVQGTRSNYSRLIRDLDKNLQNQVNYKTAAAAIDLRDFARYMIVNYFAGNDDWDRHNWYASFKHVEPTGKWRFHSWDAEHVLKDLARDSTSTQNPGKPTGFQHRLATSPDYRLLFADEVHRLMANGGPLTPENSVAQYNRRIAIIDRAIRAESARWGDNKRPGNPYLRGEEWLDELENLRTQYFPNRTSRVIDQFRARGWYPETEPPSFAIDGLAMHGGFVSAGAQLSIQGAGDPLYFTTDGSDPREAWTSEVAGSTYSAPQALSASARVKARTRSSGGEWSALSEALFVVGEPAAPGNTIISEIMFNPDGPDSEGEFLELTNTGSFTIDLGGARFTRGIDIIFDPGTLLDPGESLVIARVGNSVAAAKAAYSGALDNGGDRLTLKAADGSIIVDFAYGDDADWPDMTDGGGYSLELVSPNDPSANLGSPLSWRTSHDAGGSPGSAPAGLRYAEWRASHGLGASIGGDDHDGDGLSDIEEFASGTDPVAPDGRGTFGVTRLGDGSGIVVSMLRSWDALDLSLQIEVSDSLSTNSWHPVDPASFVGSTRVPESRADLLEFRVTPAPGSARQFVRTRYTVLQ